MPAAELVRLRQQINLLIEVFHDPHLFLLRLRDLLELYAHHAYRPGQAVQPQPLIRSYRVSPLVIRQLTLELSKTCQEQPVLALAVVEELWADPYYETRLLACSLLGAIPLTKGGQEIGARVQAWAQPKENQHMIATLMQQGTILLRREAPDQLLHLISGWLSTSDVAQQAIGLQALSALIQDHAFENLPAAFSLLALPVQQAHARLQGNLQAVIQALIKRSPVETAYFLRQCLSISDQSATARLVRRCLPDFAPAQQTSLRAALQANTPG
jgi:hypothetical protein